MRRTAGLVFIMLCGLAGLWGGYWLGHLAGWSENAHWPGQIGGGVGATILGVVLAFVGVALATAILAVPTFRTTRRLLRDGTPARANVIAANRAGLTIRGLKGTRDRICCRVEVQPPQAASFRSQAYQFMTAAEEAALLPETSVEVRYDPEKPSRAAIVRPVRAKGRLGMD